MEKQVFNKRSFCYNILSIIILLTLVIIFYKGLDSIYGPLRELDQPINLRISSLPGYLLATGIRFFLAMLISIIIAIIYAVIAAKNKRLRLLLIPLLDIFQSIPVLGYLSFTVTVFTNLAPNNILGIELAVIFTIFTAQVWNIIFSVYQSLITIPQDLYEVAKIYKLNKWRVFWQIELPFAIPGLVSNAILSMGSSWFFIVVSEVISVGTHSYILPGMGAYIALALSSLDFNAILYAIIAIIILILFFNELFFKPLTIWAGKFRYEFNMSSNSKATSWFVDCISNSNISKYLSYSFAQFFNFIIALTFPNFIRKNSIIIFRIVETIVWGLILWGFTLLYLKLKILCGHVNFADILNVVKLTSITGIRIISLLFLISFILIPLGVFIGMRPKLAIRTQGYIQFLTSIPANLYYPIFVIGITHFHLNLNSWLPLMLVVGSGWYILYNVIAGTQNIPTELTESCNILKLTTLVKFFKVTLPAIAPFYVTGLIIAAGASWNASIVAEIINWGDKTLSIEGIGSFIAINTIGGNFPQITLALISMGCFVILINHLLWKPLFKYTSTKFRLE